MSYTSLQEFNFLVRFGLSNSKLYPNARDLLNDWETRTPDPKSVYGQAELTSFNISPDVFLWLLPRLKEKQLLKLRWASLFEEVEQWTSGSKSKQLLIFLNGLEPMLSDENYRNRYADQWNRCVFELTKDGVFNRFSDDIKQALFRCLEKTVCVPEDEDFRVHQYFKNFQKDFSTDFWHYCKDRNSGLFNHFLTFSLLKEHAELLKELCATQPHDIHISFDYNMWKQLNLSNLMDILDETELSLEQKRAFLPPAETLSSIKFSKFKSHLENIEYALSIPYERYGMVDERSKCMSAMMLSLLHSAVSGDLNILNNITQWLTKLPEDSLKTLLAVPTEPVSIKNIVGLRSSLEYITQNSKRSETLQVFLNALTPVWRNTLTLLKDGYTDGDIIPLHNDENVEPRNEKEFAIFAICSKQHLEQELKNTQPTKTEATFKRKI